MIVTAALGAVLTACALVYALRLEPVTSGGRFAADLSTYARSWVFIAGIAAAAMSATAAWSVLPDRIASAPVVIAAALGPVLAFTDLRAMLLPLPLTCSLAGVGILGISLDAAYSGTWHQAGPGLVAAAGVSALAAGFWWANRNRFGSGDLALIILIAIYLGRYGWAGAITSVTLATFVSAASWAHHLFVYRRSGAFVPIGPSLITGWWISEALNLAC